MFSWIGLQGLLKGMRKIAALGALSLASVLVGGPVLGEKAAVDQLHRFLEEVRTLHAEFRQVVYDEYGKVVQEAQGTFAVRRPGKFRWDYVSPYRQVIVGDGARIWIYDVELEQVTVKPQEQALMDAPALLLSGEAPLEEMFIVQPLGRIEGLNQLELLPKNQTGTFEKVRLGFSEQGLVRMELIDAFGQRTQLDFSRVERNKTLGDSLFRFSPPAGVDVIGAD